MENLIDPDEKIVCPYNVSHHIRRCRMAVHLVKCKKNYKNTDMRNCTFNSTHIIPAPELQYHHQNCPDRRKIEAQIVESSNRVTKYPVKIIEVQSEEVWDDLNCPTYDPKQYVENNDILRHIDVESQSKRKHFRMEERQRLQHLTSGRLPPNSPTTSIPKSSDSVKSVTLPKHRKVTNIEENFPINDRLKLGANKMFIPE